MPEQTAPTAKLHLATLLDEPADGTVLVVRTHDTYEAILRDDQAARDQEADDGERWFDAADPDIDPVCWRAALEYADEVFPLGTALAAPAGPGQVDPDPATPIRVDSLFGQINAEGITAFHPEWNDGKSVLLIEVEARFDARVDVTYGVPGTRNFLIATVPADFLVTLAPSPLPLGEEQP